MNCKMFHTEEKGSISRHIIAQHHYDFMNDLTALRSLSDTSVTLPATLDAMNKRTKKKKKNEKHNAAIYHRSAKPKFFSYVFTVSIFTGDGQSC